MDELNLREEVYRRVSGRLGYLSKEKLAKLRADSKLRSSIQSEIEKVCQELGIKADEVLKKELLDDITGMGPIEDYMNDPTVTEIMVNGKGNIFVEREGKIVLTERSFASDEHLMKIIEKVIVPLGRRLDQGCPHVDARLPDGSRINAVIYPISLIGPVLTIHKTATRHLKAPDLLSCGTLNREMFQFLYACVRLRKNILISGGTSTGKTTLLEILSSYIPETERIVTIEDINELQLSQRNVVPMEARPPNIEGKGEISIRELLVNALRMRPDRIIVGECRSKETLDMLQAMNTGHDGSMTTVHANSPQDALNRLEAMIMMTGISFTVEALRNYIARAINIIVQLMRFSDGSRKIIRISEVSGFERNSIVLKDIFLYRKKEVESGGRSRGDFEKINTPAFDKELQLYRFELKEDI